MDQSKIENSPEQEWWPMAPDGAYEVPADAASRMKQVQAEYAHDANAVLFTHSTFIAHSFVDLRPIKAFGVAAEGSDVTATHDHGINTPGDVKLAGAYVLEHSDTSQYEIWSDMYDPGPVVDQALEL